MKLAVVGAGWSGLAAAVAAVQAGHQVTLFEAARECGGRARQLQATLPDGRALTLDNGQHILIGAYRQTLAMLELVGVDVQSSMLRQPLCLQFSDGHGLALPDWPAPWNALGGILGAVGWSPADKWSLLRMALHWRLSGFGCSAQTTVAQLCAKATPRVLQDLISPLCISALNIETDAASATVFLRVLRDSLFGAPGGSDLLLPQVDLSTLFPHAAAAWLRQRSAQIETARRVQELVPVAGGWQVQGQLFDGVVLATPAADASRILQASLDRMEHQHSAAARHWSTMAAALQHTAITTVYTYQAAARLARPMVGLAADSGPAQFVFDRGQLGGPPGLLAFVVSASSGEREAIQAACLRQGRSQLGLDLHPVQTVVEKRATFACTPDTRRPPMHISSTLWACGDYVEGPYPATLEGAIGSAVRLFDLQVLRRDHVAPGAKVGLDKVSQ